MKDKLMEKIEEIKFTIAWSPNEKHIYLLDSTEQVELIDIKIKAKWNKNAAIEVIKEMVKHL